MPSDESEGTGRLPEQAGAANSLCIHGPTTILMLDNDVGADCKPFANGSDVTGPHEINLDGTAAG